MDYTKCGFRCYLSKICSYLSPLSRRPENKANFLHFKIIIYNTLKQTASIHNLHVVWTLSLWCLKFTSTIVVQSKTLSKRHIGAWILNGIVGELHWEHLKSFDPALNISFIKKDSFKPDVKGREAKLGAGSFYRKGSASSSSLGITNKSVNEELCLVNMVLWGF